MIVNICMYIHVYFSISQTCLEHGEEGVAVLPEEGQHPLAGDAEAPYVVGVIFWAG